MLMFHEIVTWCLTSCPSYVRRMEYLYQAIALRGRYRRRKRSWQPHLDAAQSFITAAAEKSVSRGRVVVLGSGLLLDVPIERLTELFEEVVLVDIVHLPEVRRRVRAYQNVRLVQHDVTGVAEPLFENIRRGIHALPEENAVIPEVDVTTGLVVSLNLISQLAAIPSYYVAKKMPNYPQSELDAWCNRIRAAHLDALAALPCDVCVIADYAYVWNDAGGSVVEKGSTVGDLALPEAEAEWEWHIAPFGEEPGGHAKTLSVRAWHQSAS